MHLLSLSVQDYAAISAMVVAIIGSISAAAVAIINALNKHDAASQTRKDDIVTTIENK